MKFKVVPTLIALLVFSTLVYITSSNNAGADGVDKLGFPFMFYFKFEGKSSDPNVLRHYFSWFYLITNIFVGVLFILLVNKVSAAIFKQDHQTLSL